MDIKVFTSAIIQVAEKKGIPQEKVLETIEVAVAAAYKKDYGEKGQKIVAELNPKTGQFKFWQEKLVVDEKMIYSESELLKEEKLKKKTKSSSTEELEKLKERKPSAKKAEEGEESKLSSSPFATAREAKEEEEKKVRFNPEKHIMVKEARKINSKIKVGEDLKISLKTKEDYGRVAAQTAKQVILQKLKEIERDVIFQEYKTKEGEVVSGIVQRIEKGNVFLDIGKTLGILPRKEQVAGEFYRTGQRIKVYLLKIEQTSRGPVVFLSRFYPKLVSKLFELEVPEVSAGQVLIKAIAREAGSRTKIAVFSKEEGIDPIGSMVGQRGTRVQVVINELGGEKIDIIEWSEDPQKFITNALSPAKVLEVKILPKNTALCFVPEDQLSLAIGKNGQNVRLAAQLTGWKIDVKAPETEKGKTGVKKEIKKEKETKKKK